MKNAPNSPAPEALPSPGKFLPPWVLRSPHLQTIATLWPRRFPRLPKGEQRLVEVESGTRVRIECHWQPNRQSCPTLILLHGLEGSSESQYLLGTAEKAWVAGFNAVRMNLRNCGGTEHLTPSLYNAGLSGDLARVTEDLIGSDALPEIHLSGTSMGGNIVLKLAGEWGSEAPPQVVGLSGVSPSLDLAGAADAINRPSNFFYQRRFVRGLKAKFRHKALLHPQTYRADGLNRVHSLREFDDRFTAPHSGYGNAVSYYHRASAIRVADRISLPTLILTAEDDPFIPFESFRDPALTRNPNIVLLAPRHGGHAGFITRRTRIEDRFWAENRVVEFARQHSRLHQT